MGIGDFVYNLFGGSEWGLLLCVFIIFLLDAFLIPTLPEVFFIIAYMGGQKYGGLEFDAALLLTAMAAELIGIFTLYYVVKHIRVPRKVEKAMTTYTQFLLTGDEKLLLINRIAPMIPFAGAFIAISKWNPWKSAVYIVLGCLLKYGLIMLMADFFYVWFGSKNAEVFTIAMIITVILVSMTASYIMKKRRERSDKGAGSSEEKDLTSSQNGEADSMTDSMTIVIPTYNESKNVVNMAKAIREAYPDYKILFMDDNSTDGTIKLVEDLGDPLTKIHVREPEKRGLGASVLEGFVIADTDYAMCMDCDFQHPISALKDIHEQMKSGADLCVGVRNSRMSMGFKRAFGSKAVEVFCKFFFILHGKYTTKDMMSGLFALRCDVFRDEIKTHWDEMELRGWKVLMDLMKYNDKKLTIKYARYDFGTRAEGESHINPKVPIMTFHQLWGFGKFLAKFFCKVYHVDYYEMYPREKKQ